MEKEVESGLYQTASEVIRAGLRRLKEDQAVALPQGPKTLEELEARLLQSIDRLDRGEGVDGGSFFADSANGSKNPALMPEYILDPCFEWNLG